MLKIHGVVNLRIKDINIFSVFSKNYKLLY